MLIRLQFVQQRNQAQNIVNIIAAEFVAFFAPTIIGPESSVLGGNDHIALRSQTGQIYPKDTVVRIEFSQVIRPPIVSSAVVDDAGKTSGRVRWKAIRNDQIPCDG